LRRGGLGCADGLEVVAGHHVAGGPVGAAEASPAVEAVLPVLLLRDGDHQIAEIHAPARGGGGEAEDLLVHELRRVHRLAGWGAVGGSSSGWGRRELGTRQGGGEAGGIQVGQGDSDEPGPACRGMPVPDETEVS
jgi:hypothetical protein